MKTYLVNLFRLTKFGISLMISVTSIFGYLLVKPEFTNELLVAFISIFLLSMGVSVFNQLIEVDRDAKMPRTLLRPLVTGYFSKLQAGIIGSVLILLSMIAIYPITGVWGVYLFLFVFIWYDMVYLYFKFYTYYAVVPGSLLGMIPPGMTWIIAGGEFNNQFWIMQLFYFIWQMPHFWLLVLVYNDDYKKGNYPTILDKMSPSSLINLIVVWFLLSIVVVFLMMLVFEVQNLVSITLSLVATIWILKRLFVIVKPNQDKMVYRQLFIRLNLYTLIIVFAIILEKFITI